MVWIDAWGGTNTIAQALWTLNATRTPDEMSAIIARIRVYDILGQDDAGAWMSHTFPELLYIRSMGVYGWAPDDNWTSSNVQSHGPMGQVYPDTQWSTEGEREPLEAAPPRSAERADRGQRDAAPGQAQARSAPHGFPVRVFCPQARASGGAGDRGPRNGRSER